MKKRRIDYKHAEWLTATVREGLKMKNFVDLYVV